MSLHLSNKLTRRELEVIALIAEGHSDREISELLGIAKWTVKRHVANLLNKTGCDSRLQLAVWWLKDSGFGILQRRITELESENVKLTKQRDMWRSWCPVC